MPSSRCRPRGWRYSEKPGIFSLPSSCGDRTSVRSTAYSGSTWRKVTTMASPSNHRTDRIVSLTPELVDAADLDQVVAVLLEGDDGVEVAGADGRARRPRAARPPDSSIAQRSADRAVDLAGREVRRPGALQRERVEVGAAVLVVHRQPSGLGAAAPHRGGVAGGEVHPVGGEVRRLRRGRDRGDRPGVRARPGRTPRRRGCPRPASADGTATSPQPSSCSLSRRRG